MLGKLLKYDLRSMLKEFAFIWPAALVMALASRFMLSRVIETPTQFSAITYILFMLVYASFLIAMGVISLLFVVQRFYKGLLGDEGYLMFTLPVNSWQLTTSKLICAVVATSISTAIAIISMFALFPVEKLELASTSISITVGMIFAPEHLSAWLELLAIAVAGMLQLYTLIYLSIAIGHLFNKHRVAISFAAYIIINSFWQILIGLFGLDHLETLTPESDPLHLTTWVLVAIDVAKSATYFLITNYILKHRLNLE